MKRKFKFISYGLLILLGFFTFWISKNWIDAGRQIKLSDHYSDLKNISLEGPISKNQTFVLQMLGYEQELYKPCSPVFLKPHVSSFIARDFTKHRSHVDRAFIHCRLEWDFTPYQLTTYFLTNVYVGNGIYGAESLSQNLFQKSFEELSKEELIQIGLIIRNPALTINRDQNEMKERVQNWLEKQKGNKL